MHIQIKLERLNALVQDTKSHIDECKEFEWPHKFILIMQKQNQILALVSEILHDINDKSEE